MNSVSDIYLFSSLSFSVYYVFKSRMVNLTFEFILHLYSFFVLFYPPPPPVEGLCCRRKYWANIIHRFEDQNSVTFKCKENCALFERLKHSHRSALSVCTRGLRRCAQRKTLESQLFFVQFKDAYNKHLSTPALTLEKISVSRGEAQPFELSMVIVYTATCFARKG